MRTAPFAVPELPVIDAQAGAFRYHEERKFFHGEPRHRPGKGVSHKHVPAVRGGVDMHQHRQRECRHDDLTVQPEAGSSSMSWTHWAAPSASLR